jgi:hypothetical protein
MKNCKKLLYSLLCCASFSALASDIQEGLKEQGLLPKQQKVPTRKKLPHALPIYRMPSIEPSLPEAEHIIANHLPNQFRGLKRFNPLVVEKFRYFYRNFPGNQDFAAVTHFPDLLPFVIELDKTMASSGHTPVISKFRSEIDFHVKNRDVSMAWVLGIHLRYMAGTSVISEEERDLFTHVVRPEIFNGLIKREAWQDHFKTFFSIGIEDDLDRGIETHYLTQNIHGKAIDYASSQLSRYYPANFYYPILGQGHFGVSFLVGSSLRGVFLMAFPPRPLKAHGTRLGAFGLHDALHGMVDPRQRSLESYIVEEADHYVGRGGDAINFIERFTPHAVRQHRALMSALLNIYQDFITRLLPAYGRQEFVETMNGFFWVQHEASGYSPFSYKSHDLEGIIEKLARAAVSGLRDKYGWESSFDPLETSPIDGRSALTQEQMVHYAFENRLVKDRRIILPSSYYQQYPLPGQAEYLRGLARKKQIKAKVSSSPRFIDVAFSFNSGQQITYTFPTLFHKWLNMDDSIGLLNLKGSDRLTKPFLQGTPYPRQLAIQTLDKVRERLEQTIYHWRDRAIFFAKYSRPDGSTLSNEYFKEHFKEATLMQRELDRLLPVDDGL